LKSDALQENIPHSNQSQASGIKYQKRGSPKNAIHSCDVLKKSTDMGLRHPMGKIFKILKTPHLFRIHTNCPRNFDSVDFDYVNFDSP